MVITYALMEGLENLAENSPERVQILKKARVTKLLYEGDAVTGVEYEYKGQKYTEKGAVILATGGTDYCLSQLAYIYTTGADHHPIYRLCRRFLSRRNARQV